MKLADFTNSAAAFILKANAELLEAGTDEQALIHERLALDLEILRLRFLKDYLKEFNPK